MGTTNLKVESKIEPGNELRYFLSGDFDETADLSALPKPGDVPMLELDLSGIRRINSTGTKYWIQFFTPYTRSKTFLRFFNVSAPLIEQMNQISNFACSGSVESLALPFLCGACSCSNDIRISVDQVKGKDWNQVTLTCPKCGKKENRFDEIPETFFYFLE